MKLILVDDEELALEELGYFLKQTPEIEIIGSYTDPAAALEKIITQEPEAVFLDIEMPELNGFLLAELILKMKEKTRIVFATAFDAYAIKAFEIGAIDYVLKPLSKERLEITLRKLMKDMERGNQEPSKDFQAAIEKQVIRRGFKKVPLQTSDGFILVSPGDILFFVAQKDEIQAVLREDVSYKTSEPLNYWENRLKDQKFFRCHRSFLINLDKVEEIIPAINTPYLLKIKGTREEVPVSKTYVKEFRRFLDF
ncbi:MAG TPA: LytTR family DNA-binding domain-containing protein [Bacillota bacterium]|nr:LytTR family DNA-binding domain-containing protein [Bacillota bacterium]